jgi:hypothetical protein
MAEVDWSKTPDVMLPDYCNGKPNTKKWKDILAQSGITTEGTDFVIVKDRIYPVAPILEALRRGIPIPDNIADKVKSNNNSDRH